MPTRLGGTVHELHLRTAWTRLNRGIYRIIISRFQHFEVIRTAWERMGIGRSHCLASILTLSTQYLSLAGGS